MTALIVAAALAVAPHHPATAHHREHGCRTHACVVRVLRRDRRADWRRRHPWQYKLHRLGPGRRWTWCVSGKESRHRRVARESGYWSYFQWSFGAWYGAGGRGNPESSSYAEQAVRAWHWHLLHPVGQWPNTGEGGRCT